MKKIISLFQRNYDGDRLVRNEVVPGAEWVINGEGVATRKWDGTCCLIRDGKLYKRYEVKRSGLPPKDFEPANEIDSNTGKQQGWLPVGDGTEDCWHREGLENLKRLPTLDTIPPIYPDSDGTYELVGPKVQGNPEGLNKHILKPHGNQIVNAPRTFDALKSWLAEANIEGVVWHHPDGRMVKIKAKDFGIKRVTNTPEPILTK